MTEPSQEVDAYLSALEPDRQAALETHRALIFKTVPGVDVGKSCIRFKRTETVPLDSV